MEINNILDKAIKKVRNTEFYCKRLQNNKDKIKTYSYFHINKKNMSVDDIIEFKHEENIKDKNDSRIGKFANIFNKICENVNIYNSNYIFHPFLFENVKVNYIDLLIHKLDMLCQGVPYDDVKHVEDIPEKPNTENIDKPHDILEDEIKWVDACVSCYIGNQSNDNDLGLCDKCFENT